MRTFVITTKYGAYYLVARETEAQDVCIELFLSHRRGIIEVTNRNIIREWCTKMPIEDVVEIVRYEIKIMKDDARIDDGLSKLDAKLKITNVRR